MMLWVTLLAYHFTVVNENFISAFCLFLACDKLSTYKPCRQKMRQCIWLFMTFKQLRYSVIFLRYLIMWIFTNIFCILHMPFGCVYKQANEHFGTSKCLARCQSLLSSLCSPPAFTTLRLNMRISTAMELCAQVSKLLSEVLSVEFVVFMIKCVFQLSIGHLACEMPHEIISRISLFGDLAYHSVTFKRKMCACVN